MGTQYYIVEAPEGAICREGFLFGNVQPRPGNPFRLERFYQRLLIDEASPPDVDDARLGFIALSSAPPIMWRVSGVRGSILLHSRFALAFPSYGSWVKSGLHFRFSSRFGGTARADDFHPEGFRKPRHLSAYMPSPNARCLAPQCP